MASKTTLKDNTMKNNTFSGLGNLIKLLPTGTVFMFQFLNPVLTNNGHCDPINKYLTGALISLCGLSCFFSSFTDSYTDLDGSVHYGVATPKGLWPSGDGSADLSKYRLRVWDFVHATLSVMVFGVVSLLDSNTVGCFNRKFEKDDKLLHLLKVLPPLIGTISGTVFVMFPNQRHGIGYPLDNNNAENGNEISKVGALEG